MEIVQWVGPPTNEIARNLIEIEFTWQKLAALSEQAGLAPNYPSAPADLFIKIKFPNPIPNPTRRLPVDQMECLRTKRS
jgi:hypothetical protein